MKPSQQKKADFIALLESLSNEHHTDWANQFSRKHPEFDNKRIDKLNQTPSFLKVLIHDENQSRQSSQK